MPHAHQSSFVFHSLRRAPERQLCCSASAFRDKIFLTRVCCFLFELQTMVKNASESFAYETEFTYVSFYNASLLSRSEENDTDFYGKSIFSIKLRKKNKVAYQRRSRALEQASAGFKGGGGGPSFLYYIKVMTPDCVLSIRSTHTERYIRLIVKHLRGRPDIALLQLC